MYSKLYVKILSDDLPFNFWHISSDKLAIHIFKEVLERESMLKM